MCFLGFFWFQGQVLFGIEPDILEHDHLSCLHGMHGLPGMAPEYAVHIEDRFPEELFQFLCMGFERGEVLLSGAALVSDDHHPALLKGPDGGQVLPETFVVKNKIRCWIDRRIEVEAEENGLSLGPQVPDGSNRHPYHLEKGMRYSGI